MSAVDHPKHYNSHPSGIECIDVVEHYGFNIGNVIKYLWRAGLKDGNEDLQDMKKAAWYLNREIQKREKKAAEEAAALQSVLETMTKHTD